MKFFQTECSNCPRPPLAWIAMLLLFFPLVARAQFSTTSDGNGGLIITGYTGTGTVIVIPAMIGPLFVTSIGDNAFKNSNLTSVTIPNSVTGIGQEAFDDCYSLTSVTIPNSVTSIGEAAFYDCNSLTSLTLPASVISIGDNAFWDCISLTSLTIPNSVTSIGIEAFEYCDRLTSVTIGNRVTSIGEAAFSDCTSLTSVAIGNSVTSIGDHVFAFCTSLTSVTFPSSVASIGVDAFDGCTKLTSAVFMGNAPTMGSGAFSSDASVFSVSFYNGATGFTTPYWLDSAGDAYPAVNLGDPPSDAFGGTTTGTANLLKSSWFGYYTNASYPLVYEYNLGYEYAFPSGAGVYLYDYTSGHFWYTQSSYFPVVYDFSLQAYLFYYNTNTPHRHFYDYVTGTVITE